MVAWSVPDGLTHAPPAVIIAASTSLYHLYVNTQGAIGG